MKKIYLALLSVAGLSASAQLTQSNHAPANGDTYQMYQCDSVAPGAGGTAMTWNFAVATHSSILMSYSASTVSTPNYPNATIGVAPNGSNTAYYNSTSSNLFYYGGNIKVGTVQASLNYSAPAVYAAYPMSLNSTGTSTIGGTINITQPLTTNGNFSGTSTCTADGSGTLTVAGTTYTNVLRVMVAQSFNFTTTIANGSVIQNSYQFYQNGIKAPVMTIETSTATTPLGTSSQTLVMRMKTAAVTPTGSTVGLATFTQADGQVIVYPNPANSDLRIESSMPASASVTVYDLTGKIVASKTLQNGNIDLNVEDYSKGLYIYRVNAADGTVLYTGKLTVVH